MRSTRMIAAFAALALASGCAGSHGTAIAPFAPATGAAVAPGSTGFAYDAGAIATSAFVGPATFGRLAVDVVLPMRDADGLRRYAAAASDPKAPEYRHFLEPTEIADRFSATAADQARAIAYFHANGLAVATWKQRMLVRVTGSQLQLERAFHTRFGTYRDRNGATFSAPMTPPSVDAGVSVSGSPNIVARATAYTTLFVPSTGIGTGLAPQQIAAAFDFTGAYAAGYTGAGITIGIIGTGPVQTSSGGRVGDLEAYKGLYHVAGSSAVTIVSPDATDPVVNANSGFASPPPVTAPCTAASIAGAPPSEFPTATCNPEDFEAQIDTEQTGALARDAAIQFFLAYNPNDGCPNVGIASPCPAGAGHAQQGLAENDEEVQTAIDRNSADVLSLSYGGSEKGTAGQASPPFEFTENGTGLAPNQFAMLAAEGIAVFASSGDSGAIGCQGPPVTGSVDNLCVVYPASDPSVVGVGGVTTPVNSAGQLVGPISAWGLQTSFGKSGSGGGVSAYFTQPAYQIGAPGVLGSMRNSPDVSLEAAPSTGVATLVNADRALGGASLRPFGGTSVAAPEMAAMWALVLQACKMTASCVARGSGARPYRLGNPDALFYGIYKDAAAYGKTFLPVTYGNNSIALYCYYNGSDVANCPTPAPGSTATPLPVPIPIDSGYNADPSGGYNQITGIGVPFGRALIRAVVGV
jgi:subtilase family serine protease